MDSLSFRIPEQHSPGAKAFDVRPQAVQRWVEELPMGDTGEAARRLYTMLKETNRLRLDPSLRAGLLEMVAPAVDSVYSTLLHHFTGLSFPLPLKRVRIAQFASRLLVQMVVAHQSVLNTRERTSWLFRMAHHHLWVQSVHRMMVYLERIITNYRIIHRPYPTGLWLAMHQLYQRAKRHERATEKVAMPGEEGHFSTIEQEYKKALLQSLLEPQLFRRSQMEEVQATMHCWLDEVRLGKAKKRCKGGQAYCIHADQDAPYTVLTTHCDKECEQTKQWLLLDMSGLHKTIEKALERMGKRGSVTLHGCKAPISRDTLETLSHCWRPSQGERKERHNSDRTVEAAIGMNAIHALLERETGVAGAYGISDQQIGESLQPLYGKPEPAPASPKAKEGVWDEIFFGTEPGYNTWAMNAQEKNYQFIKAKQRNYTETGRCLEFRYEDVESLQVGELVGFRETSGQSLQLCMVRWLQDNGERIIVGLMRIAAEVEPVLVLRHQSVAERERKTGLGCLLGIGEDQWPLLSLPYLPGNGEKSLYLAVDNRELPIRLHEKVVLSPLFEAYHFAVAVAQEAISTEERMLLDELNRRLHRIAHSEDSPHERMGEDFSDVWESL